ncbi:MAG: hypothetical protein FWD71_03240 [Oscillospiraceae bacterium]|nr:hypothetical protein [Oscillospiraceae bacterium]
MFKVYTDIINWLKKLFGVNSIRKTELEQAAQLGYVIRYEDITEFNIVSVIANKLSNIVCSDASAEVVATTGNSGDDFVNESVKSCFSNINLIAARVFGIGGVVLKPYVYNGKIYTDILPQNRFFVIEQHGEVVTKAGFIADVMVDKNDKKKKYMRIEYHSLGDDGIYAIENKIVYDGDEIALADSPWRDMPSVVRISNIDKMLFAFIKCPTDNKKDVGNNSIYGVPVTYGQDKIIKMILDLLNEIPDEYKNKKAFIGADDLLFDRNSKLPENGLYRLFRAGGAIDQQSFWEVFSPEIRQTSYFQGLDYLFGLLEKSICVNKGMLTDLNVSNATATAIKRSTLDTFSTVNAMRRNIEKAFEHLVYAYGVIADVCGLIPQSVRVAEMSHDSMNAEYKVKFDWDYRLLEDTSETWKQLLEGYNIGAASLEELRMYLFNEDRNSAKAVSTETSDSTKHPSAYAATIFSKEGLEKEPSEDNNVRANIVRPQVTGADGVNIDGVSPSKIFAPAGRGYSDSDETSNPFRRDSWNMAEQSKIYRENPDIAKYLANEACKKIF